MVTNAKQVFTDDVDTVTDNNLVGSDASESIAEVEDLEIEDDIDDDTISLEDTENDVQVISDDVDELDIGESNPECRRRINVGAIAHLGERVAGSDEVVGSSRLAPPLILK